MRSFPQKVGASFIQLGFAMLNVVKCYNCMKEDLRQELSVKVSSTAMQTSLHSSSSSETHQIALRALMV